MPARLECQDGCIMALMICQPGYYCLQASFDEKDAADGLAEKIIHYTGGDMIPCPPGTYRDVSYDAVTECTPCPPNYFREDDNRRSLSSCSPCSAGTSASRSYLNLDHKKLEPIITWINVACCEVISYKHSSHEQYYLTHCTHSYQYNLLKNAA